MTAEIIKFGHPTACPQKKLRHWSKEQPRNHAAWLADDCTKSSLTARKYDAYFLFTIASKNSHTERMKRTRWHVAFRYELGSLDDRELCDLGLKRVGEDNEANKPFWEA